MIVILKILEGFLYKKADKIITVLPKAHRYISEFGISKKKIVWIPNGVYIKRYGICSTSVKTSEDRLTVMYLGAHGRANALDVVLRAAKIIQEKGIESVKFCFVGDGPEKTTLKELSLALALKNTEFRDPVPKNFVPVLIKGADALMFNLENSAVFNYGISPNKLFEYMGAGKPVIFSCRAANNPVEEAKAGLTVPPCEPEKLANAIISFSSLDVKSRNRMGKNAREYASKYHDITKLAQKFHQVIHV
jgi:glycosyltransferase involved in cell wall biosynthesis